MPSEFRWYADPFCFNHKGIDYVFCEIFSSFKGKGSIGVTEFDGKHFKKVTKVLEEPFHLSYPNVFKHNEKIYMIPETNEANQIRLYEAIDFPYHWELKVILQEDIRAVDSSLLRISDSEHIIFAHDIGAEPALLKTFLLNMEDYSCKPLIGFEHFSTERPAGNLLEINGVTYRVLQDCSKCYGERIKVYEVHIDALGINKERYLSEITVSDLKTDSTAKFERVHTLTRSTECEAVDFCYYRFYISKPFRKLYFRIRALIYGK